MKYVPESLIQMVFLKSENAFLSSQVQIPLNLEQLNMHNKIIKLSLRDYVGKTITKVSKVTAYIYHCGSKCCARLESSVKRLLIFILSLRPW